MTIIRCDLCGKDFTAILPLPENYQTENVRECCVDCYSTVNQYVQRLIDHYKPKIHARIQAKIDALWEASRV